MAKKDAVNVEIKTAAAPAVSQLIAYAPFEFRGVEYKAGDAFVVPSDLHKDASFDEFRQVEKRRGDGALGMAFYEEGEILDRNTKERNIYRHILPVKEA